MIVKSSGGKEDPFPPAIYFHGFGLQSHGHVKSIHGIVGFEDETVQGNPK